VEVTTADTAAEKKGVGVFVAPITVGSQAQSDTRRTSVGRIQFSVAVALPLAQRSK
jgi:hypothetical protein